MPTVFSNFTIIGGKLKNDVDLNENGDEHFDESQEELEQKPLNESTFEEHLTSPKVKVTT